jgi:hypothetical protein
MHYHCWGPHCPYHHGHHGYAPYWAQPFPPPPASPLPPPEPPGSFRDEYVRRLEGERDMLERRLRRLEEQVAELQRGGRST